MKPHRLALLLLALPLLPRAQAAPPPKVDELRIQKVGDVTYFHVRFETPRHLLDEPDAQGRARNWDLTDPQFAPRLVPEGEKVRHVYQRRDVPQWRGRSEERRVGKEWR